MRAEPWFFVGEHDIFPETLLSFSACRAAARRVSAAHTRICIKPGFWRRTQQRIAAGEVLEVLPYVPPEAGEDGAGAPATAPAVKVRRRQLAGGLPRAAGPPSRGGRRSGSMDALAANARRHSGEHT